MLDFIRLAQKLHLPYLESGHHHCHAGWVQIHCPFCAGGRSGWHLGYSLEQGNFNCWRCGSLRFMEVLRALLQTTNRDLISSIITEHQIGPRATPKEAVVRPRDLKPPSDAKPLHKVHKQYLRRRGFNPEDLASEWGLLGTEGLSGIWSWRLILPIHNPTGRIVAYQGRAVGDVKPKYRMTEEGKCLEDPKGFLYGIDKAKGDSIIIVEGAPGVWRLGPGAVATFGIDWKKEQANQLRRFTNRYLLFDPEPVAQKQAEKLAQYLSLFEGNTEVISGHRTDPGDFTPAQAGRLRNKLGLHS